MKISDLVEGIFATAVALDQSGGLRNTIYADGREIFIMNYDHTVLLRFMLRDKSEKPFDAPVAFRANDYDSNNFEERDGKIVFYSERGEYARKKTCGVADLTPAEVRALFNKYRSANTDTPRQSTQLSADILELLDGELSHVEFSGDGEGLKVVQRNIYSGGVIEVRRVSKGFFNETITTQFGPVAIKTDDLKALFTFQDVYQFTFPATGQEDYITVRGVDRDHPRDVLGIIACCMYDEIVEIREALNNEVKPRITRRT